jgi:putative oxidoreductase
MTVLSACRRGHARLVAAIERQADGWLLGLAARFVFLAVLAGYYLNSFGTKIGDGPLGVFAIQPGAWYQIAPLAMAAAGGDSDAVPFLPWHILVPLGTYAEAVLPVLVVLGLATRLAAAGMIGFIAVQTLTDIFGHGVGAEAIGAWFDALPDGAIADQRLLWLFPLFHLALKGGGAVALDRLIARRPAGPRA